jgi:hypothetical protein
MMSDKKTAYPLSWPEGWPRVPGFSRANSPFGGWEGHSMAKATGFLQQELDRLKATDAILSTNVKVRLDGMPYSGFTQPADVGAAVYFKLKGKAVSMACDKWNRVECNVYAIAKHIEALRGQKRWGVGNVDQAFRGYMALPGIGETTGDNPWALLGVAINATEEQITDAFRALAKQFHPDNPETGDAVQFARIRNAHDTLMQNVRKV